MLVVEKTNINKPQLAEMFAKLEINFMLLLAKTTDYLDPYGSIYYFWLQIYQNFHFYNPKLKNSQGNIKILKLMRPDFMVYIFFLNLTSTNFFNMQVFGFLFLHFLEIHP